MVFSATAPYPLRRKRAGQLSLKMGAALEAVPLRWDINFEAESSVVSR
jgi:hypothetical protein